MGFVDILLKGGVIVFIIISLSIWALAIFIERIVYLSRARKGGSRFLSELRPLVKSGKILEAVSLCEKNPSPISAIAKVALLKMKDGATEEQIRRSVEDVAHLEIPKLERNLGTLATIATVSPLLGLLGTVTGMIRSFFTIAQYGTGKPALLASGIAEALITTAAGLVVAIPVIIAYNWLSGMVDSLIHDMETEALELVEMLSK